MNLPNAISVARFAIAPAMVPLILFDQYVIAFFLLVAAGVSDALDGYIAKRYDATTVLGGFLDPAADKAMLVGAYVALGVDGLLPVWLVTLVVLRDVAIVTGWLLLNSFGTRRQPSPLWSSKVNTAVQFVLAGVVLGDMALVAVAPVWIWALIYATVITTAVSGAGYVRLLLRPKSSLETLR